MKIATWNVNSVKARLPNIIEWLRSAQPDVLLLQEIKVIDENFPSLEFQDLGYNSAVHGQKAYNGVAILSKKPLTEIRTGLPDDEKDEQSRYIECCIKLDRNINLRISSIYLPNGNPVETDKFNYKIKWMERLISHAKSLLEKEELIILGGDYNVIPTDDDCYDPMIWNNDALGRPEIRSRFRTLVNLGFTEAWRSLHRETHVYSFWDYQAGARQKDNGVRIDHLLLSPQAADLLGNCEIDKNPRGQKKASDHTPVWCELRL